MGLLALLLLALCSERANATQQVSGTVIVSGLVDQYIELTGPTTLVVDRDWYLRRIYGAEQNLEIVTNTGRTLTVDMNKSGVWAIEVNNLSVTGTGTVFVTAYSAGVRVHNNMNISNTTFTAESRHNPFAACVAIRCDKDLNIHNSVVNVSSRFTGLEAKNLTVTGTDTKFNAYTGDLGDAQHLSHACLEVNNIKFYDGEININSKNCPAITYASSVYLGEPVMIDGEYVEKPTKAKIYLNTSNDGNWANYGNYKCVNTGNLYISNCDLTAESNGDIFYTSNAEIHTGARVNAWNRSDTPYCVFSVNGNFTADGNAEVNVTGNNHGIIVGGDALIACEKFYSRGKNLTNGARGLYANNINIVASGRHTFVAAGQYSPLYATNSLVINPPYEISDGGYIVNGHEVSLQGICVIKKPAITSWNPNVSQVEAEQIGGLNSTYKVGETITYYLPQEVAQGLVLYGTTLNYRWLRSEGTTASDFKIVSEGQSYTSTVEDVGHYFKVHITADKYTGMLMSNTTRIVKKQNTSDPTVPTLSYNALADAISVDNSKLDQEYLVLDTEVDAKDISETQWATAERGIGGSLLLNGGTKGVMNYVYTRKVATDSTEAGVKVRYAPVMYGSATGLVDFTLNATKATGRALPVDQWGYLNVEYNSIIRLTLKPVPSTVSGFQGASGYNWLVMLNTGDENNNYGRLYTDPECTQPIVTDETHFYTQVYYKFVTYAPVIEIRAIVAIGLNVSHAQNFNVSKPTGGWDVRYCYFNEEIEIERGTSVTMPYETYPLVATYDTLYAVLKNSPSLTPATVTFNVTDKTVTIDATNAQTNSYGSYGLRVDGTSCGHTNVRVLPAVVTGIEFDQHQVMADPGDTLQLSAQVIPGYALADAQVTWSTPTPSFIELSDDGKVVVKDLDSNLGKEILVIATTGEFSDTCHIKVSGEIYPLTVGAVQVNSRNQHDILGDGKTHFEEGVLTLEGVNIPSDDIIWTKTNAPIELHLKGNNTIQTLLNMWNTVIGGNGTLHTDSHIYAGIHVEGALTVCDTVTIEAQGDYAGLAARSLTLNGENVLIRAKDSMGVLSELTGSLRLYDGILDGEITSPEGAMLLDAGDDNGFWACYADGTRVRNDWVVINGIAEEPSWLRGDVNGDGDVNVIDITALIDAIMNDDTSNPRADVNEDGEINVIDITALIDIIMNS